MGDSYSTYEGHIPEGYYTYYSDDRIDKPVLRGVEKTWWRLLAAKNDFNIVINDSFSGSTVCNTVREGLSTATSFISRFDMYAQENFFAENKVDTIFIFGGTNDSGIDAPIGDIKYENQTESDLKCVLPSFCYLIEKAKKVVENVVVIINTDLKDEITGGIMKICKNYDAGCVYLKDIDKENGHPTELGMEQICKQVTECIGSK